MQRQTGSGVFSSWGRSANFTRSIHDKAVRGEEVKSVNKVMLIGNLGKDPEVKYTPSGVPVAKFSLATSERYKGKSGEWQDRTEWHNIIAWQRLAEIVGEYVKKGSKIYIEGRLQTSSWEDKQSGEKKYRTEIVASDLVLLSGGRDSEYEQREPVAAGAPSRRTTQSAASRQDPTEITDEDIPF
jgi:single-strand DNA-binding protein